MPVSPRRWISYAGLAILTIAAGLLLYWLANRWLQDEFARAALELTHGEAEAAAAQLADALPKITVQRSVDGIIDDQISLSLNPNVILALISDRGGRVIISIHGQNERAQILKGMLGGALPPGIAESTLAAAVRNRFPDLVEARRELIGEHRIQGSIVVFVDPAVQQNLVRRATLHITQDLMPILLIGLALCGGVLWLLGRQRRMTERLRQQRDQAESLAHVGTLAAGLAHEIRNPVNALAMQLEMLEEDLAVSERGQFGPRVSRIRSGLANLERTIHDFLNYALPHQQRPTLLDLSIEISKITNELGSGLEDRLVDLQLRIPEGLSAWCDPHAFRQILGNLLSNAMRAQRQLDKASILVTAYRESAWVVIAVEDGGAGVSTENQQQIFNCFFTTEQDGTGLGLPIARRLAQMNAGKLEIAARASVFGGARFELRLAHRKAESHQ